MELICHQVIFIYLYSTYSLLKKIIYYLNQVIAFYLINIIYFSLTLFENDYS